MIRVRNLHTAPVCGIPPQGEGDVEETHGVHRLVEGRLLECCDGSTPAELRRRVDARAESLRADAAREGGTPTAADLRAALEENERLRAEIAAAKNKASKPKE